MAPLGDEVGEGHQDEGPLVQAGVGHPQALLLQDQVAVKEEVQVYGPGAKALLPLPAQGLLYAEHLLQEGPWGKPRLHLGHQVQVAGLGRAHGVGLVDGREAEKPGLGQAGEEREGQEEVARPVPQVAPQAT